MSRKQKKYHFIYKTTCKITGKFYVGMHSSDSLDDGYLGSGKILGYSRHKYGDENHTREILENCSSKEELKFREKEIVNEKLLSDPLNINLKYGGEGGWSSDLGRKGGLNSAKNNPSGSEIAMRRGRQSRQTKIKRILNDPEYGKNISKNLSIGRLEWNKNNKPPFEGKKHTIKSKQKIAASMQGKQSKEKNSQFGTMWINDGINRKKMKKTELIPIGWFKGRKI